MKENKNIAKEFLWYNLSFVALYLVTIIFLTLLLKEINNEFLKTITNIFKILAPLIIIGILVFIGSSMVHISAETVDEIKAKKHFIISGVLFRVVILFFYLIVFFWNASFGGSLNSVFSGILTTAPIFFIFGRPTNYHAIYGRNANFVDRRLYNIHLIESIIRFTTILIYIITVLSIDTKIFAEFFNYKFDNPLLNLFSCETSSIKKDATYNLMACVIFLGYVLAAIIPLLIFNKKKNQQLT